MQVIKEVTRQGLFNIKDSYVVYKDSDGYYGICRKGDIVIHCGFKTLDAALQSKNIERIK